MKTTFAIAIAAACSSAFAQFGGPVLPQNWHLLDPGSDKFYGISAERAYREILDGKQGTPVIVAIIDSGTESFHPDLDDQLWINSDEIPGNGLDDDRNGYADDVHGWSFIGGPGGDVEHDNLEFTRIYKSYRSRFLGKTEDTILPEEKKEFAYFRKLELEYAERLSKTQEEKAQFDQFVAVVDMARGAFRQQFGTDKPTIEQVEQYEPDNEYMNGMKEIMLVALQEEVINEIEEGRRHFENLLAYSYSLDFDPRGMVGDDYTNPRERNYGNNHIDGPAADHGTHVAGIVGAERNGTGADGICANARLMLLRTVPDGDERDKDVANSIRYAADNGARVINMSFGKSYSPEKVVVDEAVKYAESKGCLLIHAAGNDGRNIDIRKSFPTDMLDDGSVCKNWIEVGASGGTAEALVADFSNYGRKKVDVFAPGESIYSTVTKGNFKKESGTSMASPVVTGVAAVLLSYYPQLAASEVKEIILKSSIRPKKIKVNIPGSGKVEDNGVQIFKQTSLKKLCVTGGIVNLYSAVKMAENYSRKN